MWKTPIFGIIDVEQRRVADIYAMIPLQLRGNKLLFRRDRLDLLLLALCDQFILTDIEGRTPSRLLKHFIDPIHAEGDFPGFRKSVQILRAETRPIGYDKASLSGVFLFIFCQPLPIYGFLKMICHPDLRARLDGSDGMDH